MSLAIATKPRRGFHEHRHSRQYSKDERRVRVSLFEKDTMEVVFANVITIAERRENGIYEWTLPDGKKLVVNLSDGNWLVARTYVN